MWKFAALATLPGVLLLTVTMGSRPGMTWDSISYADAATRFATSRTLATHLPDDPSEQFDAHRRLIDSHPLVLWPPGYPLLLAGVIVTTGVPAAAAAALVNVLALTVLLITIWKIVATFAPPVLAASVAAVIGVTPALQAIFRMALSDGVFMLLSGLLAMTLIQWLLAPGPRLRASWWAALIIGAAIHVRYAGVLLIAVHAIAAGIRLRQRIPGEPRSRIAASVVLGPLLGSAFVWFRLATLGCAGCAPRYPSLDGLAENMTDLGVAIVRGLPVLADLRPGRWDVVGSIGLLVGVWMFARDARAPMSRAARLAAIVGLTLGVSYAAGLVALRTAVHFEWLNGRLVAPVALPLTVACVYWWLGSFSGIRRAVFAVALGAALTAGVWVGTRDQAWRQLSEPSLGATPFVREVIARSAEYPDDDLFVSDAAAVVAQIGFDNRIFWLPSTGVLPTPGRAAIAILRRRGDDSDASHVASFDRSAIRIGEGSDFVAWRLPARVP